MVSRESARFGHQLVRGAGITDKDSGNHANRLHGCPKQKKPAGISDKNAFYLCFKRLLVKERLSSTITPLACMAWWIYP